MAKRDEVIGMVDDLLVADNTGVSAAGRPVRVEMESRKIATSGSVNDGTINDRGIAGDNERVWRQGVDQLRNSIGVGIMATQAIGFSLIGKRTMS